jgi:hypothetical protein
MAFSGAWLRQNGPFEYVDMQAVHTADPAHADLSQPDPNAPTYTAPDGTTQTGFGIPDYEWMGGQGVLIEYSPQDHDLGIGETAHPSDPYIGGTGLGGGELTQSKERARLHGESYGADAEYNPAPMQFRSERYGTIRSDGFGPTISNDAPTGWRGTFGNSSPENNPPVEGWPDGFRRGSDLMVVGVDRKFYLGERYHDRHVVTPNDAEPATRQTRGTGPSAYLSPFDAAKRAITRAWNTPAKLETPPDYSQDIIAESPSENSVMPDWGFV